MKTVGGQDLRRAVFELDLLGLRAAGAALYEDYASSRRYENQDEN